jgi:hypothetical protein
MPVDIRSPRWLVAQLARFTYRPGWTLKIVPAEYHWGVSDYNLEVVGLVLDARGSGKTTQIRSLQPIPPFFEDQDELQFARWLQHQLFDLERHESREWLRRDGEIYDDPHKEKR